VDASLCYNGELVLVYVHFNIHYEKKQWWSSIPPISPKWTITSHVSWFSQCSYVLHIQILSVNIQTDSLMHRKKRSLFYCRSILTHLPLSVIFQFDFGIISITWYFLVFILLPVCKYYFSSVINEYRYENFNIKRQ
jgi:hypothetical protein